MTNKVRRIFVEKKKGFDVEAEKVYKDLKSNLNIEGLKGLRIINRYDISGISDEEYKKSINIVFAEPTVDMIYEEELKVDLEDKVFAIEFLPGQYDQRADSAAQCVQILTQDKKPKVRTAKVIVLQGKITDEEFEKVKNYCINPVESREASLEKPTTLEEDFDTPKDVQAIEGFIQKDEKELEVFRRDMGFAMDIEDLLFCQEYFKNTEKRDPTITELKVIDTYWSDHCRHTTFFTKIENVDFEEGIYTEMIKEAFKEYLKSREYVYGEEERDICLMDMAVIQMKEQRKKGNLDDLEVSDETNASSIIVEADINGKKEEWLIMFKNETHNHPTEIEPFGGAATCLGGAIRDPLSGRAYVYQAMRVTGSGDPRTKIEDTLPGKLPQRKITIGAAEGYSSYGNQIGLATGQVAEVYDEGYIAKRMEIGAVIGAAPKENVVRKKPKGGDVILLVGGRTGRDGCGGATGSSKEHTKESIYTCGAEVQKGNPPTERKIQRLFRNPKLSKLIKKCNDFGAGGVSVAVGELADSLEIDLNKVPKKYEGLDGTELAISESQERMAVVVNKDDVQLFKKYADEENLEATVIAKVTSGNRVIMKWKGKTILNISRKFLDTNGVKKKTKVLVKEPDKSKNYFENEKSKIGQDIKKAWIDNLKDLNVAGQRGLVERFDSTVGAGTVIMPFGGKYGLTPAEGMVAKLPILSGETNTCTIMTYGFDPKLSKWSPFHGAMYSVLHSIAKVVAIGGRHKKVRLTLQEYFEKLGKDKEKWGKPFSALLGAFYVQKSLGIPAIGGKDSMSGTFEDLNVPPTLVSFAVAAEDVRNIISPEFKKKDTNVVLIPVKRKVDETPDFQKLDKTYSKITKLIHEGKILSAHTVGKGGIAAATTKMAFGNNIGMVFNETISIEDLFRPDYGSIVVEIDKTEELEGIDYILLGSTQDKPVIEINGVEIDLKLALESWDETLNDIFPVKDDIKGEPQEIIYNRGNRVKSSVNIARPRIFIPVLPGTNCEYDTKKAFERAGGIVETLVFKNLTPKHIEDSVEKMAEKINNAQIIALPGGFSAGDEPDGSGKFIAAVFRNPRIKEAVMELLKNRDGLMLGICNGFQALIKLGLVPFGEIIDIEEDFPTLTFNKIGRHISKMVRTKVVSNLSPWFNNVNVGDVHTIPVSHGEGRFIANEKLMKKLIENGQIATQYVDFNDNPSYDGEFNPNGSVHAVEGITSPDGRILGKMGHSERIGSNLYKNVPGNKDQKIFEAGVEYFTK
ncbi:phosphoribosylformylglycinamidine synthase [Thermohalobacter berrensis]|uniref:Phosphoribosylformylglycinamidine synthase n=1 Tax=Thermohalobacter berrensis TaxID=99594 RepID=A0A419SUZ1_9FIRM|nr:phosphoribosylformylglycinamidine synthase [Thermohalobacter berrensis]RKD29040.1 phosphoribosylformylglycinamidine synthase [Thermohalobacter berrensis]